MMLLLRFRETLNGDEWGKVSRGCGEVLSQFCQNLWHCIGGIFIKQSKGFQHAVYKMLDTGLIAKHIVFENVAKNCLTKQ